MGKPQTHTSVQQEMARSRLYALYNEGLQFFSTEDLMVNLGLFIRSSCLAKLLYINELYEKIIDLPGVIMEFGTWCGQNLVLFTNLRAIYEPYNYTRKVIGFDLFEDGPENFCTPKDYAQYLDELLNYHEQENVLSHIVKYEIVKGDVFSELPNYLKSNPHTLIALAYIDIQEPTIVRGLFTQILPRIVPNGIIAMDELNNADFAGETEAYLTRKLHIGPHELKRSRYLPDRSYIICKSGTK